MKKIILLVPLAFLFFSIPAFAGTNFLTTAYTINYAGSQNNTTYPTGTGTSTPALVDNSSGTARLFQANGAIWASFGEKKVIDGWSMNIVSDYGTRSFTLYLYDQNFNVIQTVTTTFTAFSGSGSITPTNAYYFKWVNTSGTAINVSEIDLTSIPDTIAPGSPVLSGTAGNLSVSLSWTKPSDTDLAGYKLYRNNSLIQTFANPNTLTYSDTGLVPGTTYTYKILAYDDSVPVNESLFSGNVSLTPTDTIAPSAVTSFSNSPGDRQVFFSWQPSTDNYQVAGYRIKRGSTVLSNQTTTSYTDTGLTNGTTYTYTVEAYDTMSNFSNPATLNLTPQDTQNPVVRLYTVGNTVFQFSNVTETGFTVSFNDSTSTDNASYQIFYKKSTDTTYTSTALITDSNYPSASSTQNFYSRNLTGLQENTAYNLYLRLTDDDNRTTTSAVMNQSTASIAPATPTGLSVSEADNRLTYSWNANPENDVAGYRFRLQNGSPVNITGTSRTISSLTNGTSYCYEIAAYDNAGNTSAYTSPVCGTPVDTAAPDAPVVSATAGNMQVTINWTTPTATDVLFYRVFSVNQGNYTQILQTSNTSTTSATYPVAVGVTVYYAVAAVDDDGNVSAYSNTSSATAFDNLPPTPPTSLTAVSGDRQVALSWTASTDNDAVSGYQVLYAILNASGQTIATTTATNYTATNLTNGSTYQFTVSAFDPSNNVSAGATIQSTPQDTTAPVMKVLTLDSATETSLTVAFGDANASDTDYYELTIDNFVNIFTIDDTNQTQYSKTFSNLSGNTSYTIKGRAVDDDGLVSSLQSLTVSTSANAPATPTGLSVTPLDNKLTYTWYENTEDDLAGYKLYRVSTGAVVATTNQTTADVTGLVNGASVCFQVAAFDVWNNLSNKSAPVCGTPIDLVPPFDVSNVNAAAQTEYSMTIEWTDSSSPDVDFYKIYKNNVYLANVNDVPGQTLYTYTANQLTPGVSYVFSVNPVDDDGNETVAGSAGQYTGQTTAAPPAAPTGFSASAATDQVLFSWNANTETDLAGYQLYAVTNASYQLLNTYPQNVQSATVVTNNPNAVSYVLAAVDTGGSLSAYSSPVTISPISSFQPLFENVTSPIAASDIVESGFDLVSLLSWFFMIGIVIWLVSKLIPLVRFSAFGKWNPNEANPLPEMTVRPVDKEMMKRIESKRRKENERINEIRNGKGNER